MPGSVCAIIITYNPEIEKFENTIKSIIGQSDDIIIIDNMSQAQRVIQELAKKYNTKFIPLPENEGIAYAQNIGITYAIKHNYNYIFLMDQDTIIPENGVPVLLKTYSDLEKANNKIGSLGYAYKNTHTGQLNQVWRTHNMKLNKEIINLNQKKIFEIDFTIASGSFISTETLKKVGLMDTALFIDLVDVEWGLRAQALGYKNFQSFEKIMQHSLGSKCKKIFSRTITLHPPIRNYYIIRNSITLIRMNHIHPAWKKYLLKRIFQFFFVFGFLVGEQRERISLMLRGTKDGLLHKQGRFGSDDSPPPPEIFV